MWSLRILLRRISKVGLSKGELTSMMEGIMLNGGWNFTMMKEGGRL